MTVKAQRSLLPSAARTVTTTCSPQIDAVSMFVRVYVNVTAASGTGGLTVFIRGYDKISGAAAKLNAGGAGITTTGIFVFELSSSGQAASGDVLETVARPLPCKWDVRVVAADASSYTYSVSCEAMGC